MSGAMYVGRVGALAVALGIGAVIAGVPGMAWAGPEGESDPSGSPGTSQSPAGDGNTSVADTPDKDPEGDTIPGDPGDSGDQADLGDPGKGGAGDSTAGMIVDSSGGAVTSTKPGSAGAKSNVKDRDSDPPKRSTVKPKVASVAPSPITTKPGSGAATVADAGRRARSQAPVLGVASQKDPGPQVKQQAGSSADATPPARTMASSQRQPVTTTMTAVTKPLAQPSVSRLLSFVTLAPTGDGKQPASTESPLLSVFLAGGRQADRRATVEDESVARTVDSAQTGLMTTTTTSLSSLRSLFSRDVTKPVVSLSPPGGGGGPVSGTVTLSATASDNVGVTDVRFYVDSSTTALATDATSPYSASWNTTTVTNGAHTVKAVARDAAGNTTTSTRTVTVDNAKPVVSLSAPGGGGPLSGTVTLNATASDNVGVTQVQFFVDNSATALATDATSPYSASWNTTAVSNGTHTLSAVARDAAGNTTTSTRSVTVANPDITAPSVSLTGLTNGATVSGAVPLSATASDNIGVVGVQFYVNGTAVGGDDTSAPYSASWNTVAVANGSYVLTARARDAAGNVTTSTPVTVTVANPDVTAPSVSLSGLANGATVSGAVPLSASASDNVGVTGVQFYVDNVAVGVEDTAAPYSASWNTTTIANGIHTVTVRARDAAGNVTTSAPVTVTVANPDVTAPTVSLSAPSGPVSGVVSLSATAADNVGVAGVQFLVDGNPIGAEDSSSPFGTSFNTATVANGTHVLTARARDAAGNLTTSAAVTVTVANPDVTAPSVSLTGLVNGVTVSGAVPLSATASDNVGVTGVQFYVDNVAVGVEDTVGPYSASWNTTTIANGMHTVTVRARDAAGNITTSVPVTVTVANAIATTAIPVGSHPTEMMIVGDLLYVANSGDGSVSVIDTRTKQVVNTITGVGYSMPMAASNNGRYLYLSAYDQNYNTSVKVVDTTTGGVVKTIALPTYERDGWAISAGIKDIAISPDDSRVYVTQAFVGDGFDVGTISMIDTASNEVVASTHSAAWSDFYANIELTPDGTQLYATSVNEPRMDVYDARTLAGIGTVRLDADPGWPSLPIGERSLTFSPNGERAYGRATDGLWYSPSQTFVVIDTKLGSPTYQEQIATIIVLTGGKYLTVSPDNTRAYVMHDGGTMVTVVDTTTNTVIGSITSAQVGGDFAALTVGSDGTLYFSNYANNAVYALPPNSAPTAVPSQGAPNQSTGAIVGAINGADADGNALSYTLTGSPPARGSVTLNPTTGTFTYTPSQLARFASYDTGPGPYFDTFTVAVTDGLATTPVTVQVAVLPALIPSISSTAQTGTNPMGMVVTSTKTYVANQQSNTVSVIDRANPNATPTTINVVAAPRAIALSPDGTRAYVAGNGGVSVINTATNQVITTVVTSPGDSYGIAVGPDVNGQHQVFVTNSATNSVRVINANTNTNTYTAAASAAVGTTPRGIAVSLDGRRAYVANWGSNNVTVLDTSTATPTLVGSPITVGTNPVGVVVSPDGTRVYVSNYGSGSVSVLNPTATNPLVATVPVNPQPFGLAITPDGSIVYAANAFDTVSMIDTRTNTVYSTLTIDDAGPEPQLHSVAVSPDGRQVYISDMADRTVRVATIIRGNTDPTAGTPTVTVNPVTGVATGTVKFTDYDGDSLSYNVLQPINGSVSYNESTGAYIYTPTQAAREQAFQTPITDTFTVRATDSLGASKVVSVSVQIAPSLPAGVSATLVGSHPIDMAVAGNRLFVLNSGDGSVSVIDTDTNQVVSTISGVGYASPMVASSDGRYLYMSQYDSYYVTASVKVVDTTTGRVVKTITMPKCETECWANSAGITDIAISPDDSRVYVSELWVGDSFYGGTVTMIDTTTNDVVGSTSTSQYGDFYSNIEVSPDGTRLYAASGYPYYPQMDVLDARTLALVDTVRLDGNPGWPPVSTASLTFSPNGERAYARLTQIWPDYPSQTFAVIDTKPGSPTYNTQIATITVPPDAQYLKVSPDNKRGYVVHNGGKTVTVVDLTTNTVIGSISSSQIGGDYAALAVGDDGTLYFSNYPRNAVFFFEPGGVITM